MNKTAIRTASDGRPIIFMNEPSKEQAIQVMFRLVQKRIEAEAKKKVEEGKA